MENKAISISYTVSILALLLYFFLNFNGLYVEHHDNLDQHFGWYKLLSDNNAWFLGNNESIPHMGDISRGLLLPETQLVNIIFMIFPTLLGHCILILTKFTIGYFSFVALSNYILSERYLPKIYIALISISFALTSGNENLYIAQASIPLIAYLYIKYIREQKLIILACIFFYPILSELTRFGMFILIFMSVHCAYLLYIKDRKLKNSLVSICVLSVGYLCVEYRLILSIVLSNEDTIRKTMVTDSEGNFITVFVSSFLKGHYHFSSYIYVFIPLVLYLMYYMYKERVAIPKAVYLIGLTIVFNSFIYALYTTTDVQYIFWDIVTPLAGWDFSRFIWFNSFLWHLLILILLSYTYIIEKNRKVVLILLFLQVLFTVVYPKYGNDFYKTIKCNYLTICEYNLSYNEFYSTDLFSSIKTDLEYKGNEKVIAFGIHPSILVYNGFYTMDGYHNAYYQSYKDKFRELIEPGLDISEKYTSYYDNWGGRAYVFSEEADYPPHRKPNTKPIDLPIDFKVARDMDIKYVISNEPLIMNDELYLKGTYSSSASPYTIRVFELR